MKNPSARLCSYSALALAASSWALFACDGGSGSPATTGGVTGGNAGSAGAVVVSSSGGTGVSPSAGGSRANTGGAVPVVGGSAGAGGAPLVGGAGGAGGKISSGGSGGSAPANELGLTLPVAPNAWTPSQSCRDKAKEILAKMTRADKAAQMVQGDSAKLSAAQAASAKLGSVLSGGGSDPASGNGKADWVTMIDGFHQASNSLGIPLLYGIDAVHGHNNVSGAVMFPHNIGLGCTRSPALLKEIGRITALEVRGTGIDWAFAPVVASGRDERWGRTYETYSEDPNVSASLGAALIQGLQGTSLAAKDSVLASAKHFAGDGATDKGTDQGNVTVSDAEFQRLAIDQYQPAINAGVGSIMVSYSSFGGQKMSGYKKYLTDVLKGTMGFNGFLISDWDAIHQLPGGTTPTTGPGGVGTITPPASTAQVAAAVNAGMDMIMENTNYASIVSTLTTATAEIPDARIDDAVTRILTVKCEMGMFQTGYSAAADPALTAQIGSDEHKAVARRAVQQSLVVLQNEGSVLPIPKTAKVHVMGSGADSLVSQCGGWTVDWQGLGVGGKNDKGTGNTTTGTTLLAGITAAVTGGKVSTGSTVPADAEYVVVVAAELPYAEGKGDRTDLALSAVMASDAALINSLPATLKTVVVLLSGRPVILGDQLSKSKAWVAAWLPGSEGGGVADVLFGVVKPTGKLSHSWPKSMAQIPINVGDADYTSDPPLYPFGYGLTY